jgi:sentrin-specific protease 8
MAIARAICAWWKWNDSQDHRGRDWLEAVRREVDARSVKAMRTDLLQLINTLIQEKAKPNSASEGDTDRRSSDS